MTVLVTLSVCETLPVASTAVTVMLFDPMVSGIPVMVQFTPLIVDPSDAAALVTHVTAGVPLPPVPVPVSEIIAAVVLAGGALTVRTNGFDEAIRRVTLTIWETLPVASTAVTVMLFNPMFRGIPVMVQFTPVIVDPSEAAPLVTHVTAGVPLPPVTVPVSEIIADVVVAGGALTVRTNGFDEAIRRVTLTIWETLP